jgi:cold shock CspA family protein
MNHLGVIHHWNEEKGIGFIRRKDAGSDLYFHFTELPPSLGRRTITVDTLVEFEIGEFRGLPCARNVRPLASLRDGGAQ